MKKKLTTLMVSGVMAFALLIISPTVMTSSGADMYGAEVTSEMASVQAKDRNLVTSPIVVDVTELFEPIEYKEVNSKDELNDLILKCDEYATRLNSNLETMNLSADSKLEVESEIARVNEIKYLFECDLQYIIEQEELAAIEAAKWETRKTEYPVATKVWLYMKEELGWNDYVCAGVMGNLMAETGGQTLNLQPELWGHGNNRGYYGICQWSAKYYPDVSGQDLDYQLDFLKDTVEYEFNTYGKLYQSGMKYEGFTNMTGDCRATALAFAKAYERCNSKHYSIRQTNAEKAYEYFTQ